MSHPFHKRLLKEYKSLSTSQLPGITLLEANKALTEYQFNITFQNHEVYNNDHYQLIIVIPQEYPVLPPKVKFQQTDKTGIPMHPHIYSNGHICLNLLGDDWSPASSIESIVVSLQSMLNNNSVNERPVDDEKYVRRAPAFAGQRSFIYHDDNV